MAVRNAGGVSLGRVRILKKSDTGKAFRVQLLSQKGVDLTGGAFQWIPVDQVHDDSEAYDLRENKEGEMIVTHWIAKERGWI